MDWLPTLALAAPPNVIVIMTDDQGYGDIARHGNKEIRTPNSRPAVRPKRTPDRLSRRSYLFSDAGRSHDRAVFVA
jgi:arylsulfatase A-like enzyme